MKRILLCLTALCLLIAGELRAQERTVSGRVTSSEDGSPLPGVNVLVKGTTQGVVTDVNGDYKLSVPQEGGILVFSFIGLKSQEIAVGSRTTLDVPMSTDITQLSEVIVTGYSTQEKREVTGSISSVKGDVIENLPMQTFDRAIQGRAAGVQVVSGGGQPGGGVTVNIRGTGTINGTAQPLYIVDGVQVNSGGTFSSVSTSNPLSAINPADIQSIEILKDAAAGAIYGALAGNGVVIITTKRGKAGKTKLKFAGQYGISEQYNPYEVLNATQWLGLKMEAYGNAEQRAGGSYADGVATALNDFGVDDPNGPIPSYNWVDAILRTGKTQQYDLSLSGGDEKTRFFISGSYNNVGGTVIQSNFKRGTLRANLDHRLSKVFSMETSLGLTGSDTQGPSVNSGFFTNGAFTGGLFTPPINPIYNEDGTFNQDLINTSMNVVQLLNQELRRAGAFQTVSNLAFNADVLPGLRLRAFGGIDFADVKDYNYRPSSITAYAPGTGSETFRRFINWNTNYTANYNKKFNEVHNFGIIGGFEYRHVANTTLGAATQGFASPSYRLLSSGATPTSATSTFTSYKLAGFFANAKYDFKDKYLVSATIRYDGSSRFGANYKWGTFYGASAGWRLKAEDFLSSVNFLDDLKIRASYGVVGVQPNGTQSNGDFLSLGLYGNGGQYVGKPGSRPTQLANPDLTWEQSATINLGLDYSFFGGRIFGAVDFWKKNNTQLLLQRQLPIDSGFGSIFENAGEVENKGIDFDINTVNIETSGFKWTTNFNIGFQKNELVSLNGGLKTSTVNSVRYDVGEPLGVIYTYEYAGVNPADGRPMFYDKNNNITYNPTTTDQRVVGNNVPDFFGGFSNNFSYKGLSLEVFFNYQYGNESSIQTAQVLEASGMFNDNQVTSQLGRWTRPGQITGIPRAFEGGAEPGGFDPTNFSSRYVQTASYIRLKQITLSYQLPSSLIQRLKMSNVNVFVQAINLATFTNFRGDDPELALNNNLNQYPNPRQITGGVTIEF
ncbi:SusC/RagA family TonB-linked outer membrane protein [Chryseosolibacter indicus]|uniref:TonB-dependent receptor n=1 Tax=Chryseosolibacter indicus TaxID=2782351 RepID=A0ABS5VQR7_9BACT|nr:TonB-dependent receptor [Chryseosolibacter indicus]MBT1703129.1 TonB-dependent receptor [Chryseosolibacter indicus]